MRNVWRIEVLLVSTKDVGIEAKDEKTKYICVCFTATESNKTLQHNDRQQIHGKCGNSLTFGNDPNKSKLHA